MGHREFDERLKPSIAQQPSHPVAQLPSCPAFVTRNLPRRLSTSMILYDQSGLTCHTRTYNTRQLLPYSHKLVYNSVASPPTSETGSHLGRLIGKLLSPRTSPIVTAKTVAVKENDRQNAFAVYLWCASEASCFSRHCQLPHGQPNMVNEEVCLQPLTMCKFQQRGIAC
jgi:hypothetical protein